MGKRLRLAEAPSGAPLAPHCSFIRWIGKAEVFCRSKAQRDVGKRLPEKSLSRADLLDELEFQAKTTSAIHRPPSSGKRGPGNGAGASSKGTVKSTRILEGKNPSRPGRPQSQKAPACQHSRHRADPGVHSWDNRSMRRGEYPARRAAGVHLTRGPGCSGAGRLEPGSRMGSEDGESFSPGVPVQEQHPKGGGE